MDNLRNLNAEISLVSNVHSTETKHYPIEKVLNWIKTGAGNFPGIVKKVRKAQQDNDRETKDNLKKQLPAALFSGKFAKRNSNDLLEHSGIICLDFDHIEDIPNKFHSLTHDPHILCVFNSPSGDGLKALVAIPKDESKHKESFAACKKYFNDMYELDPDEACSDTSRLCFLSYDPGIFIAETAFILPIEAFTTPKVREKAPSTLSKNDLKPGEDYNNRSDVMDASVSLLQEVGWSTYKKTNNLTYLTRDGKNNGVSGTVWDNGSFYCFTSSSIFPAGSSYSAFGLFTYLKCGGDYKKGAKALAELGYGSKQEKSVSGLDYYNKNKPAELTEEQTKELESNFPVWTSSSNIPDDLSKRIMMKYPVLVDGLLHRGTKMVLGGGSKSYKTWTLLNLAICVASGTPWWGREVISDDQEVVFINFEVAHEFFLQRVLTVCKAMNIEPPANLKIWSLRGKCNDLTIILEVLKRRLEKDLSLIVIDPIYKGLGGRDENSAGEVGQLMNEVEALVEQTGAAACFGAHYSKGNQAEKDPLDRISGSGVFARDPDTILGLTAHEELGCFTVHSALRNWPGMDPFVVQWDFPLFSLRQDLNPNKLRRPGQKVTTTQVLDVVKSFLPTGGTTSDIIERACSEFNIPQSTAKNHFYSLRDAGTIQQVSKHWFTK